MIRERIIKESLGMFSRYGVRSTTMDDIAKNIGISKRTIYENFKDKEDLLTACIDAVFLENERYSKNVFIKSNNVLEAIIKLLRKGFEHASKQKFFLLDDVKKYYPKVHKEIVESKCGDRNDRMRYLIEQGIKEDVFRNELNPGLIAYVFARYIDSINLNDEEFEKYSFFEIFENMVLVFIRGLCTSKGLNVYEELIEGWKS